MNIPAELKYTKNDEWVRVENGIATFGITDFAQNQLSDIVFVEVTVAEGETVTAEGSYAVVESVKAASDVYAPISGKVIAINGLLEESPEIINSDPYGDAWMIKVELTNPAELDGLMDAGAYQAYCEEREH